MTTTDRLKALLDARHAAGLAKYGTTVDRTDLSPDQWAQHAIEEMLDGAAYLVRLKEEIERREERIATLEGYAARLEAIGDVFLKTLADSLEAPLYWNDEAAQAERDWNQAKEAKP